jgi:hypothetical protein
VDAGTSSIVLAASNASNHDDNANDNNVDKDNAAGKKTLVSAINSCLVALVMMALSAAFVFERHHHRGGKDNNGGGWENLAKAVPMSMLVDEDVVNLCNGGGNDNGIAYNGLYYGAAGGGAIMAVSVAKVRPAPPTSRTPRTRRGVVLLVVPCSCNRRRC